MFVLDNSAFVSQSVRGQLLAPAANLENFSSNDGNRNFPMLSAASC